MRGISVEPKAAELLPWGESARFDAVVNLPAVLVGCHPGRYVACVTLSTGDRAYLKRELHVTWRERLRNWWCGFGFVSRSVREAKLLASLRRAGIAGPDVLAAAEGEPHGAYLLLRELTGWVELRSFLRDHLPASGPARRKFARTLGTSLARVHAAGFGHSDLYSKHVLVHPQTGEIRFLDWQRARYFRRLSITRRARDLATLDATLGTDLAGPRLRLACLRAYGAASGLPADLLQRMLTLVRLESERLQGKRRIRELRQEPLAAGAQHLVPLEDGTLYVAPDLVAGTSPVPRVPLSYAGFPSGSQNHAEVATFRLPDGRQLALTRRRVRRPRGWLWAWLRRRPLLAPEREQADTLFRLQRYRVATPRLLAYGQRQRMPWQQESLLLVEFPPQTEPLPVWLRRPVPRAERHHVLAALGRLLQGMHAAGCYFGEELNRRESMLLVRGLDEQSEPLLGTVQFLTLRRQPDRVLAAHDLGELYTLLRNANCSPRSLLGFVRAYLGTRGLTREEMQVLALGDPAEKFHDANEPGPSFPYAARECGAEA